MRIPELLKFYSEWGVEKMDSLGASFLREVGQNKRERKILIFVYNKY